MKRSRTPTRIGTTTIRIRIPRISQVAGGLLLLAATVVALVWANLGGDSPWSYDRVFHTPWAVGPLDALGLHLTFSEWVADGLLAVFFFLAGYEVKREFTTGSLASPRAAVLPVAAAAAGVAVPAVIYTVVVALSGRSAAAPELWRGWAVPTATDIAFALAVLAVVGRRLPGAARTFLLTLAVVDDLIAILIIAVFYSGALSPVPLAGAALTTAAFAAVVRAPGRGRVAAWFAHWWVLAPLAVLTWYLVHASGVHATIAGVALAFTVPTRGPRGRRALPAVTALAPVVDAVVLPLFALSAAGVRFLGQGTPTAPGQDAALWAVFLGLLLGKPVGIVAGSWVTLRLTHRGLNRGLGLSWTDLAGLGMVGGIGFTVALLVAGLSMPEALADHARLGVLAGSAAAAVAGGAVLAWRNAHWARVGRVQGVPGA